MSHKVDLDALEKLHAASTQGEWRVNYLSNKWILLPTNTEGDDNRIDNAEFVAAAHNALPALIAELRELRELVGLATEFEPIEDVKISLRSAVDGRRRWAVVIHNSVLAKDGELEYEPLPSSRTEEFIKRTRYDSIQEALAAARKWEAENA